MEANQNPFAQQQQIEDDPHSQPLGGEMGGPPMMLSGASDQHETSGNQSHSLTTGANPFGQQQNSLATSNPLGPFASQKPPLSQATLIKSVMKLIPKFGQADKDRHQYREQIADSLIREGTNMSKDRLLELDKQINQFINLQQSKFSNDGCSSGGSQGGQLSPHTVATSIDSSNNKIALVIQLSLWVEEIIFEKFQDSATANYRTLVRRLSQALRQKEEQKSTLMTCSDRESVSNFVQEFMNQRNSGLNSSPFGRTSAASSNQIAQGAPGTGNGMGGMGQNNSANAGGEAESMASPESSQNNQEQSAQQNPFGGIRSPFGAPPSRGGPAGRGGPGGRGRGGPMSGRGRAPGGRGRGAQQRFVAPIPNFSVPASSGSQMPTNAPPLPKNDNDEQQTNQQSIQNDQNCANNDVPPSSSNQSPQQQMIESGTDYDSSVLMTTSISTAIGGQAPSNHESQIKGNDQNNEERDNALMSQNFSSQLKDSGSLERDPQKEAPTNNMESNMQNLDFLDQLAQQQTNHFGGGDSGAPNMNLHGQTQNNQNSNPLILDKKFDAGPSSGDQDNSQSHQENQNNQAQANEQYKEEISSVGISKFKNENEERPDFDRSPPEQNIQQQPINAQAQYAPSSQVFQGQMEVTSNQQMASSLFADQPTNHEQKNTNSNQGGQQSQFDQQPDHQDNLNSSQRQIQNQQDQHDQFNDSLPPNQNSNQQQEQFGGNQEPEDSAISPGETGSQQQQNQQNSNQQQAIDNTTNQQNSQPPGSIDILNNDPPAPQMRFNTMSDELIEDGAIVDKLNLSMHSKPSGTANSGRITPPSQYSSSRRMTNLGIGKNSGSRKLNSGENEGTGSVQMSNDQSTGELFMQQIQMVQNQHKKINEQIAFNSTRVSHATAPMSGGLTAPLTAGEGIGRNDPSSMNPYRSFNNDSQPPYNMRNSPGDIVIDDYQSEQNAKQSQRSSARNKGKKASKAAATPKSKNVFYNQSYGFIPHQSSINASDPIGTASVASIPITTFEDTQKMLAAYKKKKREIMKMKDQYFKLEQEFMTVKQKNILVEEELTTTQKRLARVEKQLKQNQLKEHINDDSITQRQLQLKIQEQEITQGELKHQKSENQKLREKVKELLKKCSQVALQSSSQTDSSVTMSSSMVQEQDMKLLEQQHQLELVRQREQKNLEIRQLQDELNFMKKQNEQLKTEQETSQNSMAIMKNQQDNSRSGFERQIEDIRKQSQAEIDELRSQNEALNSKLNEHKFKRPLSSRPSSANKDVETKHKAEIANYETVVRDLNRRLQGNQELFAKEKEMILADIAAKDAVLAQMEQERQLMQIQLDQQEQQINQSKQITEEVSQRADRLQAENDELKEELNAQNDIVEFQNKQIMMQSKRERNAPEPPKAVTKASETQTNLEQSIPASELSQSQRDRQVVNQNNGEDQVKSSLLNSGGHPGASEQRDDFTHSSSQQNERADEVEQSSKSALITASTNPSQRNVLEPVFDRKMAEETPPVVTKTEPQAPPTAQGLFQSPEQTSKAAETIFEKHNNITASAFEPPPSGGSSQQTSQHNAQSYFGGGTSNVMIQSKYFGDSNKQSGVSPDQFFDKLAYSQQQQPQGSQQHKPSEPDPYNFAVEASGIQSQQMPPPSITNKQQPIPSQQKKKQKQKPAAKQGPTESNPYDFMVEDDDDNALSGQAAQQQTTGPVIPNSMFD